MLLRKYIWKEKKIYSFPCELLLKWPFTHIQNIPELPHFADDPPSCSSVHWLLFCALCHRARNTLTVKGPHPFHLNLRIFHSSALGIFACYLIPQTDDGFEILVTADWGYKGIIGPSNIQCGEWAVLLAKYGSDRKKNYRQWRIFSIVKSQNGSS